MYNFEGKVRTTFEGLTVRPVIQTINKGKETKIFNFYNVLFFFSALQHWKKENPFF